MPPSASAARRGQRGRSASASLVQRNAKPPSQSSVWLKSHIAGQGQTPVTRGRTVTGPPSSSSGGPVGRGPTPLCLNPWAGCDDTGQGGTGPGGLDTQLGSPPPTEPSDGATQGHLSGQACTRCTARGRACVGRRQGGGERVGERGESVSVGEPVGAGCVGRAGGHASGGWCGTSGDQINLGLV